MGGSPHFPKPGEFQSWQVLPFHRWTYTAEYLYYKENYSDFASGSAYVLPISTFNCLYEVALAEIEVQISNWLFPGLFLVFIHPS